MSLYCRMIIDGINMTEHSEFSMEEIRKELQCVEPCDECPAYEIEPDYENEEEFDESN